MSGIQVDSLDYQITRELDDWKDYATNNPAKQIQGGAAMLFADLFDETDNSDVKLGKTARVGLEYESREYTNDGYIDIDGAIHYNVIEESEEIEIIAAGTIEHGGMRSSEIDRVARDISEEAVKALEEFCNGKKSLNLATPSIQ